MTEQDMQKYEVEVKARRYEGRTVIVCGGAQGLGRMVARRIGQEGGNVVIADIQEDRGQLAATSLQEETGSQYIYVGGDLSKAENSNNMAKVTMDRFGRIDAFITTAAYQARLPLLEFPEEEMRKMVDWNVWNLVYSLRAVLPQMMEQEYGRIVTTGGAALERGVPYHSFLTGVGKAAQVGLVMSVAGEFGRFGITANCVSPSGNMKQDGTPDSRAGGDAPHLWPTEAQTERYRVKMGQVGIGGGLIGRPAHLSEVAAIYAFLASPECSYLSGQYIYCGSAHL
jgi:NAD(P)-dependent dehydrogenase (short-subunit alcohol dehydrogenase family)